MKAVIVDIKGRYAAVLTETGSVERIINKGYSIGTKMSIDLSDIKKKPFNVSGLIKCAGTVAAAVIIVASAGTATAYAMPYGTVSVDINPSIEYTINCFDVVLDFKASNEDGEAVLSEIDPSELRYKKVDKAVQRTVEQFKTDGYFADDTAAVNIYASTWNDEHSRRLQDDIETMIRDDMGLPPSVRPEVMQNPSEIQYGPQDEEMYDEASEGLMPQEVPQDDPTPGSLQGPDPADSDEKYSDDNDTQAPPGSDTVSPGGHESSDDTRHEAGAPVNDQ